MPLGTGIGPDGEPTVDPAQILAGVHVCIHVYVSAYVYVGAYMSEGICVGLLRLGYSHCAMCTFNIFLYPHVHVRVRYVRSLTHVCRCKWFCVVIACKCSFEQIISTARCLVISIHKTVHC